MVKKRSNMHETIADRVFDTVNTLLLFFALLIVLYPLIYVVSSSLSTSHAVISGEVWLWPVGWDLAGYEAVFNDKRLVTGFLNSFFYMTTGTLINVTLTIMAAYPLSRKDFLFRGFWMFLFAFTMMFSGGLIPYYLLVRELGMLNTRWAMIIPNAMSVWNVIITRTFFQTNIPDELLEASQLDGCSDFRFVWSVVVPLSYSIIAVNALFYAVGHWNSFFDALIFLKSQKLYPLQIILRDILIQNEIDAAQLSMYDVRDAMAREALKYRLKYSLIVVASVPVLVIYPFVQKHFVKGVMIGSLKG
ncbi:multiple sugar transport system permease protein/putative aldouronate transport system permease protein [Caldicoprobacter guelmensis]|uniref:carbohydrate ABC transporter permease n=1 Tax=Caldicoprobacter guelmensis TaxID=1170224 RepID=UPI0019573427|nr:carbohydrate ABC transporter permease [Caldicoprobacter guelmensis]MBM7583369.1 multiple sugar transport system permease protein/putative aldouronate transport system permease protein [Caldicoprobacter guelmensis]